VAQPGAVWLAKATGNPLLPFHAEAAASWTLNSWDRTQIPKPFTRVGMAIGEPLFVDRNADGAALEDARQCLERALTECRTRARDLLTRR
jgi:lysophospholipid acyltransferase (LPLAT)-like uncharacterized protein